MFNETTYNQHGMGAFDWGSFLGGIGQAINQGINQGQYGSQGQINPQVIACTNAGGYWNPTSQVCVPRNTTGSDVAFSGSAFFWVLAGVIAYSLLSNKRR